MEWLLALILLLQIHSFKQQYSIRKLLKKIKMTNEELVAQLEAQKAQVEKIILEIQALKELVANSANVPQNVIDAVNALGSSIQAADDENAD